MQLSYLHGAPSTGYLVFAGMKNGPCSAIVVLQLHFSDVYVFFVFTDVTRSDFLSE